MYIPEPHMLIRAEFEVHFYMLLNSLLRIWTLNSSPYTVRYHCKFLEMYINCWCMNASTIKNRSLLVCLFVIYTLPRTVNRLENRHVSSGTGGGGGGGGACSLWVRVQPVALRRRTRHPSISV